MDKLAIYMRARHNEFSANAIYQNGIVTVLPGSKVNPAIAAYIKQKGKAMTLRKDPSTVDASGTVLKECVFTSPSTAAQFVNGRMTNGYIAWRVDEKTNLKKWLAQEESKQRIEE